MKELDRFYCVIHRVIHTDHKRYEICDYCSVVKTDMPFAKWDRLPFIYVILVVIFIVEPHIMENNNNEKSADDSDSNSSHKNRFNKCETIEEGTFAFMHWLNSDNKTSLSATDNPIVLLKFINDRHTILYDTAIQTQIDIEIKNGVPYCKYDRADDCAHIGFAIEVEQLFGPSRSGKEQTIDELL